MADKPNLTSELQRLIGEYGADAVRDEAARLTKRGRGRPSKEDDDRDTLVRAGWYVGGKEKLSVSAALQKACNELDRPWRDEGSNGEKQYPDKLRLLRRIREWVADPEEDDKEYFESMIQLADHVDYDYRVKFFGDPSNLED